MDADGRGRADPARSCSTRSGWSRSRRRPAARASTCSSRSTAARPTRTRARFAEIVAGAIARTHPKLATTEWSKARRRGVLIDANQNGEGKTIASAYSVRPKPGAPVSTPLGWDEVNEQPRTRRSTRCRWCSSACARHGDLYAGRADDAPVALEGAQVAWLDRVRARRLLRDRELLAVDHRVAQRDRAQLVGGLLRRVAELRVERLRVVEVEQPRPERRQHDRDPRHEDRVSLERRRRPLHEERDEDADGQAREPDRRDRLAEVAAVSALHERRDDRRDAEHHHRHVADEHDAVRAPQVRRRARERLDVLPQDRRRELAQLARRLVGSPCRGRGSRMSWLPSCDCAIRRESTSSERTPSTTSCTAIAREQQPEHPRRGTTGWPGSSPASPAPRRAARRPTQPTASDDRGEHRQHARRPRDAARQRTIAVGDRAGPGDERRRQRHERDVLRLRAASPPGKSEPRSISSATSIRSSPPAIESEPIETCR